MAYVLGVEIGATKQQLAVGDETGKLLHVVQEKLPLPRGAQDILDWLQRRIPDLLSQASFAGVDRIGVGFGGPIESRNGRVLASLQVPGWEDFELKTWFEASFALPAYVYNDTAAGGYAELMLGAGRGSRYFFYTNIGSGIGGVLFYDGSMFDGTGFGASYMGNSYVPDWTAPAPGKAIEMEKLSSGMNTEIRLRRAGYVPKASLLIQLCGGRRETITCAMLAEAVRAGDAFATEELDNMARSFSIALANFLMISPAERVAIGGGVAKMGDILFDRIRRFTAERVYVANRGRYEIVPSQLLDDAVIAGAVLLAGREKGK